jgi:cholesterol transport system auxiliary component
LVRHPAASADAGGGVRALTVAVDEALQELEAWVQQVQQAQAAAR